MQIFTTCFCISVCYEEKTHLRKEENHHLPDDSPIDVLRDKLELTELHECEMLTKVIGTHY